MAGFKFRLEKILDHRETLENIKKGEFAKVQATLKQARDKVIELREMRQNLAEEKESTSVNTTTMDELQKYNNYINDLDRMIKTQLEEIENIKIQVEEVRLELIESTKDKKIIEKLKLRDYQEFLYEEKKEEEKITDQFVSYSSSTNVMGD